MAKKDKSAKRKARGSETVAEVLSHQGVGDKDGLEVKDDSSEPTMGEKLASLNLEENISAPKIDSVAPVVNPPSADSVYILLKQALRADDRSLVIDCLFRQDEKVITNSVSSLNPSDVLKLLQSLVSIIQLRGSVLACAIPWLESLLLQHAGSIMSQESSVAALNSLCQLIESRISNFNSALQLSTCLDLLCTESVDDGDEENDRIVPVIYEDESDDGSADSMEVEGVEDGEEAQVYSDSDIDISDDEVNA